MRRYAASQFTRENNRDIGPPECDHALLFRRDRLRRFEAETAP